jgi:hypothetical protein
MDLPGLRRGIGKERGIPGIEGHQARKEENSQGNQENPYDLTFQLIFDGIFNHGFSSLFSLEINPFDSPV